MFQGLLIGAALCLTLVGCGDIEPPPDFLQSKITSPTRDESGSGQFTVEEFVGMVKGTYEWRAQAEDFAIPMLLDAEDKTYVLKVRNTAGRDIEVVFVHLRNKTQGGGTYSWAMVALPGADPVTGQDLVIYLVGPP